MALRRIIRITFEADETFAVRRWRSDLGAPCPFCGSQLGAVSAYEAAWLLRIDPVLIHTEIEAGRLHVLSGDAASSQVCLGSVEMAAQDFLPNAKLQIRHTEENS